LIWFDGVIRGIRAILVAIISCYSFSIGGAINI